MIKIANFVVSTIDTKCFEYFLHPSLLHYPFHLDVFPRCCSRFSPGKIKSQTAQTSVALVFFFPTDIAACHSSANEILKEYPFQYLHFPFSPSKVEPTTRERDETKRDEKRTRMCKSNSSKKKLCVASPFFLLCSDDDGHICVVSMCESGVCSA